METDDPQSPRDPERVIGREMRRIRESQGLTQQEVAERMARNGFRFHQTQIAKMERGERPIRVNEWLAISTALGTTPQDMLSYAITSSAGGPTERLLSLAELERAREMSERQLQDATEVLAQAMHEVAVTNSARDSAEAAHRQAVMNRAAAEARAAAAKAEHEHLVRRIWDVRSDERRAQEESALDSVLDDAESAIAALDDVVAVSIGKRLAAARRKAGMSVDALSSAALLSPEVVRALEHPDYASLIKTGLEVDSGGFGGSVKRRHDGMKIAIARYAKAVGLDPDPLINQYENEMMKKGE